MRTSFAHGTPVVMSIAYGVAKEPRLILATESVPMEVIAALSRERTSPMKKAKRSVEQKQNLTLKTETVRVLNDKQLREAAGGAGASIGGCGTTSVYGCD